VDLPSFFNSSYAGFRSKGTLIQGEGAASKEVQRIGSPIQGEFRDSTLIHFEKEDKAHLSPGFPSGFDGGITRACFPREGEAHHLVCFCIPTKIPFVLDLAERFIVFNHFNICTPKRFHNIILQSFVAIIII
jgi:hypothetical protein